MPTILAFKVSNTYNACTMKSLAGIILLLLSACVSHDEPRVTSCNVDDPVQDLPWLKAQIDELNDAELSRKYWFITQAIYKSQTVFIVHNCCPNCGTLPAPVYACDGELLFRGSDEEYKNIKGERLIWKSAEYACTF